MKHQDFIPPSRVLSFEEDKAWKQAELAAIRADPGRSLALELSEYCDMLVHVHHPMAQMLTARLLEMVAIFKLKNGGNF
jgi:hypothetical protein